MFIIRYLCYRYPWDRYITSTNIGLLLEQDLLPWVGSFFVGISVHNYIGTLQKIFESRRLHMQSSDIYRRSSNTVERISQLDIKRSESGFGWYDPNSVTCDSRMLGLLKYHWLGSPSLPELDAPPKEIRCELNFDQKNPGTMLKAHNLDPFPHLQQSIQPWSSCIIRVSW